MKKIIIAILSVAGALVYLLSRKKTSEDTEGIEQTHHLTQVFSKAKQHAINK